MVVSLVNGCVLSSGDVSWNLTIFSEVSSAQTFQDEKEEEQEVVPEDGSGYAPEKSFGVSRSCCTRWHPTVGVMSCVAPLHGWLSRKRTPRGKRSVVFRGSDGLVDHRVTVPCGQCIECRLSRSRDWAIRCAHEASLYDENSFVTLTYADKHLPDGGSLVKSHLSGFLRRLRRRNAGARIRFFGAGEYGDFGRPHYHVLLFGYWPSDARFHTTRGVYRAYVSDTLESIWSKGLVEVGTVTFKSAGYVAKYVTKKYKGSEDAMYGSKLPEFGLMSRRPGIGYEWFQRYKNEIYETDSVVVDGREVAVPAYYDVLMAQEMPEAMFALKREREKKVSYDETGVQRLEARRIVREAQVNLKKGSL